MRGSGAILRGVHVLFVAPETNVYNLRFVDALKRAGAKVSGIGHAQPAQLSPALGKLLDGYRAVKSVLEGAQMLETARDLAKQAAFDRIETIDEPAVEAAAALRAAFALPGTTPEQARLCRDKAAMKEALRARGVPCAASAAVTSAADAHAFVEREGLPVVLKPLEGFGTLDTFRVSSKDELERALAHLKPSEARKLIVEEFVEGHEGFYDTITAAGRVAHDFVGHYDPTCLAALQDRAIRPKIACTNRIDLASYRELRDTGQRVIDALGLRDTATHMEWFFGPKGLKISEIGARPAGERIWDMHAAGNEFDLYLEWADAVLRSRTSSKPSRRFAVGSVQIRPDRDGRYRGHEGLDVAMRAIGAAVIEHEVPRPGAPTQPLDRGWHVNTWFRLRDPDYDRLRAMLDFLGRTVVARAS